MSLRRCIERAVADGELARDRADDMLAMIDEERAAGVNEFDADRAVMDRLDADTLERERRFRLQIAANDGIRERIMARRTVLGDRRDPGAALPDLIEHQGTTPHSSVWSRYRETLSRAHAIIPEVIARFERDALSRTRNRADLDNMVRAAFGENTDDQAARELADAWGEAAEYLRARRNAAGGNTRKLDDWGLPQAWDEITVARAGKAGWVSEVRAALDMERMIDHSTGRRLTSAQVDDLLDDVYDSITSGGRSRREASGAARGRSMARRRTENRILHFRTADDWLNIQRQFGSADPFSTMMQHIDEMAREIGAMEILGPNPNEGLRYATELARKEAAEGRAEALTPYNTLTPGQAPDGPLSRVDSQAILAERMLSFHTSAAYAPVDGKLSRALGDVTNLAVSAKLGSAALSALSDVAFGKLARAFNGMPQTNTLRGTIRMMSPGNAADRAIAIRSGLIAEGAAQVMAGQARYVGDFASHAVTRRLADMTLRWSLLSPWTQAGKWSFGMEMMGFAADQARKGWRGLQPDFRAMLQRHGLDESDWAAMRGAELFELGPGARVMRAEEIRQLSDIPADRADRLAQKWAEMIQVETSFAVPSAGYRALASFGVAKRGTFMDAVWRSVTLFKSFPMGLMHLTSARMMQAYVQHGGGRAGAEAVAWYMGKYFLYLLGAGALAIQLKEISKGRDPRPMDTTEFVQAAILQGGGLGIFGDFLFADVNRFGGGLAETVAGPLLQTAGDVANLAVGNVDEIMKGEDPEIGKDLTNLARGNTPGGSIWYLRLAYERLMLDSIQEAVDPDAGDRFRRLEQRYASDYDQGYWWAPGERAPDRAPDLGNLNGSD